MAACPATLSPLPLQDKFHDDVFLSDTDDERLLNLNNEDTAQFATFDTLAQSRQLQSGGQLAEDEGNSRPNNGRTADICSSSEREMMQANDHDDDDGDEFNFIVVEEQPRRNSDPDAHFQPSQIEEKLLNHHLLGGKGVATERQADMKVVVCDTQNSKTLSASDNSRSPRGRRASVWNGVMACLTPVVGYFKKEKHPKPQVDEWEIDFADIRELNFIGSGAQGAVFAGEYLGKKVAVKKMKDQKYCEEAWNLRKLNHPNIVKLM